MPGYPKTECPAARKSLLLRKHQIRVMCVQHSQLKHQTQMIFMQHSQPKYQTKTIPKHLDCLTNIKFL